VDLEDGSSLYTLPTMDIQPLLDAATFNDDGLVAAIAQDDATGDVLMLAYMNRETLQMTLETGVMTYWSRSRQKVWVKGETSGDVQSARHPRVPALEGAYL
jgi:phosphoribosyl-AMP cyclohydrolase